MQDVEIPYCAQLFLIDGLVEGLFGVFNPFWPSIKLGPIVLTRSKVGKAAANPSASTKIFGTQ
jgi:hypothetical protein